jgi:hypothetical protein
VAELIEWLRKVPCLGLKAHSLGARNAALFGSRPFILGGSDEIYLSV